MKTLLFCLMLIPLAINAREFEINAGAGITQGLVKQDGTFNMGAVVYPSYLGSLQFVYSNRRLIAGLGIDLHKIFVDAGSRSPVYRSDYSLRENAKVTVAKAAMPVYIVVGSRVINSKRNKLFIGLNVGCMVTFGAASAKFDEIYRYGFYPYSGNPTSHPHIYEEHWGNGIGILAGGEISYTHFISKFFGLVISLQPRYCSFQSTAKITQIDSNKIAYGGGEFHGGTINLAAGVRIRL